MVYGMLWNSDGLIQLQTAPIIMSATNPKQSDMGDAVSLTCLRLDSATVTLRGVGADRRARNERREGERLALCRG